VTSASVPAKREAIGEQLADHRPGESVRAEVGQIPELEGLRGVAVLWVLVFHYFIAGSELFEDPLNALIARTPALDTIVRHGYYALDLFFLISGFLLTLPWFRHAAEGKTAPSARDFYVRRIRRIVPAYYVQLAFLFLLAVPLLHGVSIWWLDPMKMLGNVYAHLFFLHYTTPLTSSSMSINGVLWSLTLEAQYYLLLPLLAPFFVRFPWRSALAFIAVAITWRWLAANDMDALVHFLTSIDARPAAPEDRVRILVMTQLPGYLGHFAVGILAGREWLRVRQRVVTPRSALARFALAAVALTLAYAVHAGAGIGPGWMRWLATLAAFAVAMVALISHENRFARLLLANPPIAFFGRISYSVFLYHLPLLFLWVRFAAPKNSWLSFPVYFALVLVVAWLSYRYIETPFLKSKRQRRAS
jgi:peptidoglycan/LPS O-acetylase OafA/YrhL